MTLRIIHVGFGGWGTNWHEEIIRPFKQVKVVGCVDGNTLALAAAQEKLGLKPEICFETLAQAIEQTDAEAVVITAGLAGHAPLAREALRAGLHVLVEKPFVATEKEARDLAAYARRRKRVLMVSQNYRFFPSVRAVQQIIHEQQLGPVGTINIDFRRYANNRTPGSRHYTMTHPLLLDMAVHQMDLLRAVLDVEPRSVVCYGHNPPWSNFEHYPTATALIHFPNDVMVTYRVSWIAHAAQTAWAGEWTIDCAEGAVVWTCRGGPTEEYVQLVRHGGSTEEVKMPRLKHIDRAGCLDAFVGAVETGAEPETSARDNVGTVRVVNALIASAKDNSPIRLRARSTRTREGS
ncbi:MAG: gfo/Idh/MocA family oxidoreductase [Chitinivibrionales bacterium]|nr:gfo/Idh/MocA family oxidoreductase [Chitinivibrionales bacterium]